MFPKNSIAKLSLYLSFFYFVFGFLQTLVNIIPFFVILYGWRSYFMYMPLAFIIAEYTDIKFAKKIAAFTCYIAIPMAILTYIQYKSPTDAFINKNVGGNNTQIFTISRGIVRPSGTFPFFTGQTIFIVTVLIMLLFNYFMDKRKFLPEYVSYIAGVAFVSNLAVSGSRSAYGSCLIVFIFLISSSLILINKRKSASILLFSIIAVVIAVGLFNAFFSEQIALLMERQSYATEQEGAISGRVAGIFTISTSNDIPYLGYGIGTGSVGGSYISTGSNNFALAESEWARIQLENGYFFGFLYIFFRILLAVYILKESLQATIRRNNPIPFIICSFTFPFVLVGQLTMNGTTTGYGCIFIGFTMAINKLFMNDELDEKVLITAT